MANIQSFHAKELKPAWFLTVLFILLVMKPASANSPPAAYRHRLKALKTHLLRNYTREFAPFQEVKKRFPVWLQYSLSTGLDLNTVEQVLTTMSILTIIWKDPELAWNSSEAESPGEGIDALQVPSNEIWTPRLVIVNVANDKNLLLTEYASVVVHETGLCVAQVPLHLGTSCNVDVRFYPFETQQCQVTISSLYGDNIRLTANVLDVDLSDIVDPSGEWVVQNVTADSNFKNIPKVNATVAYVTFGLTLHRRPLFYILTVLFPMAILSVTGACGFLLPLQCGEKVSFQVAIMVSLSVFLSFINDSMPKTSTKIPLLALYLDLLLLQSCLSLLATLTVLRGHYHLEKLDQQDKEQGMVTATTPIEEDGDSGDDDGGGGKDQHDKEQGMVTATTSEPQNIARETTDSDEGNGGWKGVSGRSRRFLGWLRRVTRSWYCCYLCCLPPRCLDVFFFVVFLLSSIALLIAFVTSALSGGARNSPAQRERAFG